jgi:hypothetical protein
MATSKKPEEQRDLRAEAIGGGNVPEGVTLPPTDTQREEDTLLQTTQTDRVYDEPTSSPTTDRPTLNSPGEEGDITQDTPTLDDAEKPVSMTLAGGTRVTVPKDVAQVLRGMRAK